MKATRYEQVADRILGLIQKGVLKEGDKIPSIRQLSSELNVSINTIIGAYWRLEDQDFIVARPQSGFYVKRRHKTPPKVADFNPSQWDPQKVSLCRIFGAFQQAGEPVPGLGLGIAQLDHRMWPAKKLQRGLQDALRDQPFEALNYLMVPGDRRLREQIARLSLAAGLDLSPDEILITNGCQEAIFISLMTLCKPGDTVVMESPIYFSLVQVLEQLGLKVIEIPSSAEDGINLDTLRFVLEHHCVRAMFSIPNFNNPTGFVIPPRKKRKLVNLLTRYNVPLIEDDIYGDLSFGKRPDTCKSYDKEGKVILCSSFSKTLTPGLRVGWIVPGIWFDEVMKWKALLNISTPAAHQMAVAGFLKTGGYERHMRKVRKGLRVQMDAMRTCILTHFPQGTQVSRPRGGLLLWVALPAFMDAQSIYQEALKQKILIAPGYLFTRKNTYANCMRLNAGIWNAGVAKAIERLGKLCRIQGEKGLQS